MSCYRSNYRTRGRAVDINMAPLIDMIFILLIFFIVTTSFVKEAGIDVQRPGAETAEFEQRSTLQIGIDAQGLIYVEGQVIDSRSVRGHVATFLAESPDGAVLVVADKDSRTQSVVEAIDQCRLAGARNISLASRRPE
ncbi:MAG: biopolymer transporter ExbD [Deltaproteobacteria bacterium]|nr:biopolymer transporter ExbD [Deltaproteobacteria bacterium]